MRSFLLAGVLVAAASTSSWANCLTLDNNTFHNSCSADLIFNFKTIGGGCHTRTRGGETIGAHGKRTTSANHACGGTTPKQVEWNYCIYNDWVSGSCHLPKD
ncbi:hypothetical protein [Methylobacterium sp. Leaf112]|uniref:hypothetical protein n=1 Tax=Methylobacterium sp. Leaf112 TaxID=1736258 RepID=UPI000701E67F|nr:hypothetical protein [Methylobacterium sp. Leaf112]KQP66124.1 hypothetical protein ASF52_03930 [Methylobacterium sp. Leaf112]